MSEEILKETEQKIDSMSILDYVKTITLIAITCVSVFLCVLLYQISSTIKKTESDISGVATHADAVLIQTQDTIKLSGKLINDSRVTMDEANKAIADERFYYEHQVPDMLSQVHNILGNVDTATSDLHDTVTASTKLVNAATDRVNALAPIETRATTLVGDIDKKVNDPAITASLANLQTTSANAAITSQETAATMKSVQAIAKDGQDEVHSILHPKPLVSIANWTLKVVHALGGWFTP